ncbi:MAG: HlyD family type I secretion periplasmic adaptor subunit [Alphaproteobacteria bacterium]|nr:HlyD family type I secretion periplasmic adaptor subunit [Alphaproteobacteria bacterium]
MREFILKSLSRSRSEQLRYLPQSVKMEEAVNPHIVRLTMVLISAAILIFIVWASLTEINEVTRADGEVVPQGFVQVVQHLDGGLVREILTGEGDLVDEGQILIRIDDGGARQDLAEAQALQNALEMQSERLHAFVEDRQPDFKPFEDDPQAVEKQRRVFASMMDARQKERQVIEDQIAQKREVLNTLNARQETLEKNIKISEELMGMTEQLNQKGSVSKKDYLETRQKLNDLQGDLAEAQADIAGAQSTLAEFGNRLSSLNAKHRDEAYSQLNGIESEIKQNREVITKLKNRVARLDIKAPVMGVVKGLNLNTIGGVVEPGRTLMEIVPVDKTLVVEARILPSDIGHVKVGQEVRIKVRSFDFSRYGAVEGTLDFVTATTFLDDLNKPYYRGRVALSQNYVGKASGKNIILPGMTVEADIVTGRKTILAYLLKPIHLSLRTALSER